MHHILMLTESDDMGQKLAGSLRPVAAAVANPVVVFSSEVADTSKTCPVVSPVSAPLPPQLELLTLQMLPPDMNISLIDNPDTQYNATTGSYPAPPVGSAVLLLRLRHLYAAGEGGPSSALGKPVTVDLTKLFAPHYTIKAAVEMTLSASATLADRESSKLHWQQTAALGQAAVESDVEMLTAADALSATTIAPMELRTWKITVQ
jgi:hypothetical protein